MKGPPRHRLQRRRKEAGLSQAELAKRAGTLQQQVQRIEAGHHLELGLAVALARTLGTSLEDLFPREMEPLTERRTAREGA